MDYDIPLAPIKPRHSYGLVALFAILVIGGAWYTKSITQVSLTNSQASTDQSMIVSYPDGWEPYQEALDHQSITPVQPVVRVTVVYDPALPLALSITDVTRTMGYASTPHGSDYYIATIDSTSRVLSRTKFTVPSTPGAFTVRVPWDEKAFSLLVLNAKKQIQASESLIRINRDERAVRFYTLIRPQEGEVTSIVFVGSDFARAERIADRLLELEPFRSHRLQLQFHLAPSIEQVPADLVISLDATKTDQDIIDELYRNVQGIF